MATIVHAGGGTDIAYEEVGRINSGDGYINADLKKYVAFGLIQTWKGTPTETKIMSFITASEFKAKTKMFRSCDGTNSGGIYYVTADYVNDTKVHISVTESTIHGSVGAVLYGFYIE